MAETAPEPRNTPGARDSRPPEEPEKRREPAADARTYEAEAPQLPGARPEFEAESEAEAEAEAESGTGPEGGAESQAAAGSAPRGGIGTGPGRLLVTLYGIFTVGAGSRSIVQLSTRFHEAPLAYLLSAAAAVVYAFITVSLVRGGELARKAALLCCCVELFGVLAVGTWTLAEPSAFPDATVWSDYGMGYLFIPVVLPLTGLYWLRRARTDAPVR